MNPTLRQWMTVGLLARLCGAAVLVAASLCSPPLSSSAQAASGAPSRESAMQSFQRAADGDTQAIEPAADALTALSLAQPGDPVLMAYAGAATSMRATTTLLPWRKMRHAEDGLALLDKALAMLTPAHDLAAPSALPAGLETRFTAASTFLSLPGLFNRRARGEKLLAEVQAHPAFTGATLRFRASVWMRAAAAAQDDKRLDEARRLWSLVAGSGAPQAAAAQARLKEIGA